MSWDAYAPMTVDLSAVAYAAVVALLVVAILAVAFRLGGRGRR